MKYIWVNYSLQQLNSTYNNALFLTIDSFCLIYVEGIHTEIDSN